MIALRPYQQNAIVQARERIASGRRAPLIVAPCGSGKTVMMAEFARLHLAKSSDNRCLLIAPRHELVGQICNTLLRSGISDFGQIVPGVTRRADARVQVASLQTLRAREEYPDATFVAYDECRHILSDDWSELGKHYAHAIRIGFDATPMRSDGRGMGNVFDSLVIVSSVAELTQTGMLAPCRVIAPKPLQPRELAMRPVDAYVKHAEGKRTIVFASTVLLAQEFAAQFQEAGIKAAVVHGRLCREQRFAAFRAHEKGAVLVNVMICTEGFDSPATACAILARRFGHVGTYLQAGGRILRPHVSKKEALLIDLTGVNYEAHGTPAEERVYSLTGKGIRTKGKTEVLEYCAICGDIIDEYPCSRCGHTPKGWVQSALTYVGEELQERYARKREEAEGARVSTLARWLSEARARGHKPWSASAKFRGVYGINPDNEILRKAHAESRQVRTQNCARCQKDTARLYAGECGACHFRGGAS